ncbi:MAG: DUF3006 domain-containing protein [Clostridia bacterium]|nr:DUF3006 domain-containing protein [Clostridia bacterium]
MMRYTVDRIIENIAVLEDENKKTENVPLNTLPPLVREGNVLFKDSNGNFVIDTDTEAARRQKAQSLIDKLFKK